MMRQDGDNRPELHDLAAAFGLLTRLPAPVDHARAGHRGMSSGWAYPIVGAVVGALAGALGAGLMALGAAPMLAVALALTLQCLTTGALHEDGLADSADGLAGGHSRERRLEIMRDSRIGVYGMLALLLAMLARTGGLLEVSGLTLIALMAGIGAASRAVMVFASTLLPDARSDGLGASHGRASWATSGLSLGLGLLILMICTGWAALLALPLALVLVAPFWMAAYRAIGGRTGDILGGSQILTEIGLLLTLSALA